MDELILEPYAVVQRWTLPQANDRWEKVLSSYLEALAEGCQAAGPCVVGHIKALALFPGGGYLRLSVVAPQLPAAVEGMVPPGSNTIDVTINVIVYGIHRSTLEQITWQAAKQIAEQWKGAVSSTDIYS